MPTYNIKSGVTSTGIILSYNDRMTISSGGTAINTTTDSYGPNASVTIMREGTALGTVVGNGVRVRVDSGAIVSDTVIKAGGRVEVRSGAVVNNTTVKGLFRSTDFVQLIISSGATASNTTIDQFGNMFVSSGGTANNTVINSGGTFTINGRITANGLTVNQGGRLTVNEFSNVKDVSDIVENGGYVEFYGNYTGKFVSNSFSGLVLSEASATIHSGTTASDLTLDSHGSVKVYSGGSLVSATVNSRGVIEVSAGGKVSSATVNSGGNLYVSRGGSVNGVGVGSGGSLTISEHGTATNIEVNSGAYFGFSIAPGTYVTGTSDGEAFEFKDGTIADYEVRNGQFSVSGGGIAENVTVGPNGSFFVYEGGSATGLVENGGYVHIEDWTNVSFASNTFSDLVLSGASATVHSGTTARGTVVRDTGELYVLSGGIADKTTVESDGGLYVLSDGTATDTTVEARGVFHVSAGGTATGVVVNAGIIHVSAGGTAAAVVENGGFVEFEEGADVGFAANEFSGLVLAGASATVHSGTTATRTTISLDGGLEVFSDGLASMTSVSSGGSLFVFSGGFIDNAAINPGGHLSVRAGGNAAVVLENGGYVDVEDGATVAFAEHTLSGLVLSGYGVSATVHSGTTAEKITIRDGARLDLFDGALADSTGITGYGVFNVSGGTASNTTVHSGNLYVSSGGTAADTTIDSYGRLTVYADGSANNTTLGSNGYLYVSSGGAADHILINTYGRVEVSSDGAANHITVNDMGTLVVSLGGVATEVMENGGYVIVQDGADVTFVSNTISDMVFSGYGTSATIHSGTTAINTDVRSRGTVEVFSGGTANRTTVSEGFVSVFSGGEADDITLNGYGCLNVLDGGIVNGAEINAYGSAYVYTGGTADGITVNSGGELYVYSSGTATAVLENGGFVIVLDGADVTFVSNTISGLILSDYNESATVHSGTVLNNVIVTDYSRLYVFSGGKVTGKVICRSGYGYLSAYEGAILDFDLTQTMPGAAAKYSDLSTVSGNPSYTITVSTDQAEGIYILAEGAAGFSQPVTVYNTLGVELGVLSVGESFLDSEVAYTLNLSDDTLTLQVGENVSPSPYTSNGLVICNESRSIGDGEIFFDTLLLSASLEVHSGGIAGNTRVGNKGSLVVYSGGKADDAGIGANGQMSVFSGGAANGVTVSDSGEMIVSSGAAVNDIRVNADGRLYVFSGGTATDVAWTPCEGYVTVEHGASVTFASEYSGIYYGSGNRLLSSAAAMDSAVIESSCEMYVMSQAAANGVTVKDGGAVFVCDGAAANSTTVNGGGSMQLSRGGAADGVTVGEYGDLVVSSGGSANGVVIADGGCLTVAAGGSAANITAHAGASLNIDVASDTFIQGTSGGVSFEIRDGRISNYTVDHGILSIHSGGTADGVRINSNGILKICSGGTALNLDYAPYRGRVFIEDGATVTFSTQNAGAFCGSKNHLISSGMILSSLVLAQKGGDGDELQVVFGGAAIGTMVGDSGSLLVSSGGTAILTEINSGGIVQVSSGGIAVGTILYSSGSIRVSGGGLASATVFENYYGTMHISSGGTANSASICKSAYVYVSSGGTLTGRIVGQSGVVSATKGGIIDFDLSRTLPGAAARFENLSVVRGDPDYTITVSMDQAEGIYILAEGAGDFSQTIRVVNTGMEELGTLSVGGTISVSGVAYQLDLADSVLSLQIGEPSVPPPYTSNGFIVDGSPATVLSGEVYFDTQVNSGGVLVVSSGGGALETRENGGYVDARTGAEVTFASNSFAKLTLSGTSATIHSGTTAVKVEVQSDGYLHVFSGGSAKDISWTPCEGRVLIEDGAEATFTSRYSGVYRGSGNQLLAHEATMGNVTLDSACEMYVMSDGSADGITVNSGGRLVVSSGGAAAGIVWTPCEGQVLIDDGADVTFASRYTGVYYGSDNQLLAHADTMSAVTLDSACEMYVMSDAIAHSTVIRDGGLLQVSSGGLANSVAILAGGSMRLSSGAYAVSPIISSGGSMRIASGGTAVGLVLYDRLQVSSAGLVVATMISSGGKMTVKDGVVEYSVVDFGGSMSVEHGVATNVTVSSGGALLVSSGAMALGVSVSSGAYLGLAVARNTWITGTSFVPVSSGSSQVLRESAFEIGNGVVSDYVISSGYLEIHSGAIADDITVSSAGSLILSSGGTLTGRLRCDEGVVSAVNGAVVVFDLDRMSPWASARISNLSLIQGAPSYSITVTGTPAEGVYTLAEGAEDFHQTITVTNELGEKLNTLSVGKTVTVSDVSFRLSLSEGVLSLQVGNDFESPSAVYNDQVISASSHLILRSGGVANETIVESCRPDGLSCGLTVSGGTANRTTVNEIGWVNVLDGGILFDTVVNSVGLLFISSGGTANRTRTKGDMWIYGGAEVNDLVIDSGGYVYVYGINIARQVYQALPANLNNTVINSDGRLVVRSGGTAAGVVVNSGGLLGVRGGTATDVTLSSGAQLELTVASDTYLAGTSGGSAFEFRDGKVSDFAFESANLYVGAEGVVSNISMNKAGCLRLYGGTGRNVTVNQGCSMVIIQTASAYGIVENGGFVKIQGGNPRDLSFASNTFTGAVLAGGDSASVHSGTTANSVTVGSDGFLQAFSGGKLTGLMTFESGAIVRVYNDTILDFDLLGLTPGAPARVNDLSLIQGSPTCTITVSDEQEKGGYLLAEGASGFDSVITVRNTLGDSLGTLTVNGTLETDNRLYTLNQDDDVLSLTCYALIKDRIIGDETVSVAPYEVYRNPVVNEGGKLDVSSGGTATEIRENGGYVQVADGADVTFAPNTINGLLLENATATIHSGTTAVNVTVNTGGKVYVSSGGTAVEVIENGGFVQIVDGADVTFAPNTINGLLLENATATIHPGTTANSVTVSSGGSMCVFSGGRVTGMLSLEEGAVVSMEEGAILDFDLSRPTAAAALVNDLSVIRGTPLYTLTVSGEQMPGVFVLAKNIAVFDDVITVRSTFGGVLGSLSVGNPLVTADTVYLLDLTTDTNILSLAVMRNECPTVSNIHADIVAPTRTDVTVTAEFADDFGLASTWYRIGETGEWLAYTDGGVTVTDNTTVFFKAVDTSGNESGVAEYRVENIDRDAPEIELVGDNTTPLRAASLTASTEDGLDIFYSTDNDTWTLYEGVLEITANGIYYFMATDAAGNTGTADIEFGNIQTVPPAPENLVGTPEKVSWGATTGAEQYIVEYSTDNFEHVIQVVTSGSAVDMPELPAGTYQWRVKSDDNGEWAVGETIVSEVEDSSPKVVRSNEDGNDDLFFAAPGGTWDDLYFAKHVGSVNDWTGTNDFISASGKGRIQNLFFGSADPNVLCLTDADNGDAIFVDDVYTELPEEIEKNTARLYKIQEVRAGAGDDIVDMTSQRFEYVGDGLTIRGGDGNDVVWANKGNNRLFGDAGNDRLVGASGNDVIVGGIGDDRMHGGGGDDVFTFCGNWGADTVKQLETGTVTLWFASAGDTGVWDEASLTYTDGENSVTVSGVAADRITLKFGENSPEDAAQFTALSGLGAFDDFTSRKVFEESKGLLAGS